MICSKEKRREARYTTIEDSLRILAILPPDMWRWEEVAERFIQGVLNASVDPIDENLHNRDWFAFALSLLKDDPKQRGFEWAGHVEWTLYNEQEENKVNEKFDGIVKAFRRFEDAYYDVHADLPFTERPGSHPVIAVVRKLRDDRNLKLFSYIDGAMGHYTPFVFMRLLETRETPFVLDDMYPSSFDDGPKNANRIQMDIQELRDAEVFDPEVFWDYFDSTAYSHGMVYRAEKNRLDESTNLMVNNPVLCENMRLMTEAPPELSASQESTSESENASVVKADMEAEEKRRAAVEAKAKKDAAKRERKAAQKEEKAAQAARPLSELPIEEVLKGRRGRFEITKCRASKKNPNGGKGYTIHDCDNHKYYRNLSAPMVLKALRDLFVEFKDGKEPIEYIIPLNDVGWKANFKGKDYADFYNEQTETYLEAHPGAADADKDRYKDCVRIIPDGQPLHT